MLPEEKNAILTRIHSTEINVRAIISMVETGKDCKEVLLQLQASQAALHAAGRLLLSYQLQRSIDNIRRNPCSEESSIEIERLVDLYSFSWIYS